MNTSLAATTVTYKKIFNLNLIKSNVRPFVIDESSYIPSIDKEKLKAGACKELAILYALWGFRADIENMKLIKKEPKDFVDMVGKTTAETNRSFLHKSHTLFISLMNHFIVKNNDVKMLDILNKANVDIFEHNGNIVFKDSENGFLANLN